MTRDPAPGAWPELPLAQWEGTRHALHMCTQLIGKTLLACAPPLNHWWHTALRVSAHGLASPVAIPTADGWLDLELDLVDHALVMRTGQRTASMPLVARSVHALHDEYLALLDQLGVRIRLWPVPVEVPQPVPFDRDDAPRPYDAGAAHRFWQVLRGCAAALETLCDGFVGKQSPVHFFWGSFDLAATRFSGRRAPERPGADAVNREAYSHEVISWGFWPGGASAAGVRVEEPVLYAYAAPEPPGFREADPGVAAASYDPRLGEFLLPYAVVRAAPDPAAVIRAFCEATYRAGATLGGWDRAALERGPGRPAAAR
ncbi:DUF5996 family protein [Anaeromyxobacter dehalogenans]|uniref:Ava_C0101 and related proteins n=1 Tax=Anaeromyxobacter dehalogenans (strain 2CP-C) TaxID=290397 RepID=Q2INC2_ANADE|nr:DUF5996 family protein [Anaeromyxobacter dehalogenans]ABC80308.1 conserved hypothetical protein [Anaeromyxobacter dehalogenans 2CP-C]